MKRQFFIAFLALTFTGVVASVNVSPAKFGANAIISSTSQDCDNKHSYTATLFGETAVSYSWTIFRDAVFLGDADGSNTLVTFRRSVTASASYTICVSIVASDGQTYSDCYIRTVPAANDCNSMS